MKDGKVFTNTGRFIGGNKRGLMGIYKDRSADKVQLNIEEEIEEEIQGLMRVHKGGLVERLSPLFIEVPPDLDDPLVVSKDVGINQEKGTWARVYLPKHHARREKLPILVYFHGGGFCLGSAAWSIYHSFISHLAREIGCLVVSVSYRLAPECKIPSQYEDGIEALEWVSHQKDAWLVNHGNLRRIFIGGDSAGANIAHHVSLSARVALSGCLLMQPFFGGEDVLRWEEEIEDPALPHKWVDTFWKWALPEGATKDHPACNPLLESPKSWPEGLPILVLVAERDLMRERGVIYANAMTRAGKPVRLVVSEGVGHGFQVFQPNSDAIPKLLRHLGEFVKENSKGGRGHGPVSSLHFGARPANGIHVLRI
ncbi:hypothetical protein AMTR_s00110p00041000 [Amborella trichopoda]|uniref:Alpha/beta hydrolase fold-3 domain-containing protein n=2 Tax=Amborella trichopoda TaxID=13333 RepID=W1NS76_AMBTC|nr:hypothetical protein AMTR_s00110p00041000 [Amborella trichopoda]